jgi:hypothetical protein
MRQVSIDDVAGLSRYAAMRDDFRRRIIEMKRARRISVGDKITFVFENFDTVLFQIQEMLHAERVSDLDRVREEIEVYNELLPRAGELSATMLIEIVDQERIQEQLVELIGVDEAVTLAIDDLAIPGEFEPGRSTEDKLSAVQYVRFVLAVDARARLARPGCGVELRIDHPAYRAATRLSEAQRASLAGDFA